MLKALGIFVDKEDMDVLQALKNDRVEDNIRENVKTTLKTIADKIERGITEGYSNQIGNQCGLSGRLLYQRQRGL